MSFNSLRCGMAGRGSLVMNAIISTSDGLSGTRYTTFLHTGLRTMA